MVARSGDVVLSIPGDRVLKSSVAKNSEKEPVWNENFCFLVDDVRIETLSLVMKDGDNLLVDALIGQCRIPFGNIVKDPIQPTISW
jgi:Ca2+-dependent lipid-binding protein